MQAIMLQMAAAKELGIQKFDALDHLTVSMAHPDATAAMLGGPSEIVANFSSAPFQYRQMKNPNIRRILTSTELFDGGLSFNVIAATTKFRRDNPKLYGAFLAALKEATDFINADKKRASEIYLKVTNDKTPLADILDVLADPAIAYTTKVVGHRGVRELHGAGRHAQEPAGRLARHVLPGGAGGLGRLNESDASMLEACGRGRFV